MKEKFKPRLTTINEEYCIPDYIIHKNGRGYSHMNKMKIVSTTVKE